MNKLGFILVKSIIAVYLELLSHAQRRQLPQNRLEIGSMTSTYGTEDCHSLRLRS